MMERKGGCIGSALRLQREFGGTIVWVFEQEHAYLIDANNGVLNLEDQSYFEFEDFTAGELRGLISSGKAQIIRRSS